MNYLKLYKKSAQEAINLNKEETAILYLLQEASNMNQTELYTNFNKKVECDILEKFTILKNKYLYENIPVQYLIGYVYFMGYKFYVDNNVLIPRFETEELVEHTLYLYDEYFKNEKVNVCDIGCGSGCIAISLAKEIKNSNVYATDISVDAINVAKKNALLNEANINFLVGDMVEPLINNNIKVDIFISNPPYIPLTEEVDSLVKDNEPNIALFGGSDGMFFYNKIIDNIKKVLNTKFIVGFEHAYDKKDEMKSLILSKFDEKDIIIKQLKDINGKDRMTFIIGGFND